MFYTISSDNINAILNTIKTMFAQFKLLIFLLMGIFLIFWLLPHLFRLVQDWAEDRREWILEGKHHRFRVWRARVKKLETEYTREARIKAYRRKRHIPYKEEI